LTCVNTWGQTPLHSAFDSDKEMLSLDAVMAFLGIVEFGEEVNEEVTEALLTPDAKSRLPLHIAAEKCVGNFLIVGLLAECCPKSTSVCTKEGLLGCHIFRMNLLTDGIEDEDEEELIYTFDKLCGSLSSDAIQRKGPDGLLPLHMVAEWGMSFSILEKFLSSFPEAASVKWKGQYPLEVFENGVSGKVARAAMERLETGGGGAGLSPEDRVAIPQMIADYHEKSDLLFSYYPEATTSSGVPFRRDNIRMARLERRIRNEALSPSDLSTTSRLVWTWMCQYSGGERDNYSASVGRIISNLDSTSLWKLTFVKTPMETQGQFVKVLSGRTVAVEAEERAPSVKMGDMFQHRWFFPKFVQFLNSKEAVKASLMCRKAWKQGVRPVKVTGAAIEKGTWDVPDGREDEDMVVPPQPWQRVELVVPECTHSFIVSYDHNGGKDCGGGLLILRSDVNVKPNDVPPWGPHCVAAPNERDKESHSATLCVNHTPSCSYGLWYYLPSSPVSFTISNVKIRQILYQSDVNNRTPLQILLSRSRAPPRLGEKLTLLLQSHFLLQDGDDNSVPTLFLHHALKNNIDASTLSLLIEAQPSALLDTDKDARTPLHASFLLSSTPPSRDVITTLLRTPGENALKLKDATGRLPLHIAAERGASAGILKILVTPYSDSCYRVNKDGDLPLHLLVRSGNATTEGVSLLLQPILHSESIVKMKGSGDETNLPLHIACEYNCSLEILSELLKSYPAGAEVRRGRDGLYPLEILESRPASNAKSSSPDDRNRKSDLLFSRLWRITSSPIGRCANWSSCQAHIRGVTAASGALSHSLQSIFATVTYSTFGMDFSHDNVTPNC